MNGPSGRPDKGSKDPDDKPHPLTIALRNTAMRLTLSRAAVRMFLRHHAWVPPQLN